MCFHDEMRFYSFWTKLGLDRKKMFVIILSLVLLCMILHHMHGFLKSHFRDIWKKRDPVEKV